MSEHRSLTSLSDFKTRDSSLSESIRRKVASKKKGEVSSPISTTSQPADVHRISCFIRPKKDKDGGARSEELLSLVYDPKEDLSSWLEETTLLLREPIRGSNTFPKCAALSPTTYIVALYSLDLSTYPACLDRVYTFDAILNNILPGSHSSQQCFFLRTIDQHASGMNDIGGEWLQQELKIVAEQEAKKGVIAGSVVNLNLNSNSKDNSEGDSKDDGKSSSEKEMKETPFKQDLMSFARHTCFKLSCVVEAAAREEIPPDLLAKWLVGGLDRSPVLTPAYWTCLVTLLRDRALSDPNRAIIPLSNFLGACLANGAAKCSATVVRDQPTSKAKVRGEQSARYMSRADPRGLGMHFLEQASFTTIDESDDTTYANPRSSSGMGFASVEGMSKNGNQRVMGFRDRNQSSIAEEDGSSLGDGSSHTDISEKNSAVSMDSSSVVSSISVNSYEDGTSVVGMPKVRYTEFNDRSNLECGFYCSCLSCKPDPELENGDEEVYGLGAVRYWWYADWYPSRDMDAFRVGNQYTERSAVRRIALGQPVMDALKGAPLPFVIRRRRRQAAFLKAVRMNDGSDTSLPTIADAVSSSSVTSLISGGGDDDEEEEEGEIDHGLIEMKKMMAMQGTLHLCSDANCPVRRQELKKSGAKLSLGDNDEDDEEERHFHKSDQGEKTNTRTKASNTNRSKNGGGGGLSLKKDGKSVKNGGMLADNNPLKAMQVGFGVHHTFELEEENGLHKVSLPFNVPDVRVDLLDTVIANGVVARIWFAKGQGLGEKSFADTAPKDRDKAAKKGTLSNDGDNASISGNSSKSRNSVAAGSNSLPNIASKKKNNNNNNGTSSDGSVASSLVEQHEEEMQKNNAKNKERTVKAEDIPQQHYIDWESLNHCKKESQWHGPFNSDGAAHRHLHNFLDFSHIIFEVLLRQPITTRLKLLHALVSSSKVSLKQRANFGFLLDNAKILRDKEEALEVLRNRLKLRNKSLRWQLPILLYTPSRRVMQMAHYRELEKKLIKSDAVKAKKQQAAQDAKDKLESACQLRANSPDYAAMFLSGMNSDGNIGGGLTGVGVKKKLRRGSHAPVTENTVKIKQRMDLFSTAAKTAGLISRLDLSAKQATSGIEEENGGNDSAVGELMAHMLAQGKDKYGAGYLSSNRMKYLVGNMRGKTTNKSDENENEKANSQNNGRGKVSQFNNESSFNEKRRGLFLDEGDEDIDGYGEEHCFTKEDEELFDEEKEKIDSLIDLAVELFRNQCVRADQILLLLESLMAPVNHSHVHLVDTSEARSVAMPGLHNNEYHANQHHKHHHHKQHGHKKKKKKEIVEYDAESVLVACRLLLTGIGYHLDTAGDQPDAAATKHDILKRSEKVASSKSGSGKNGDVWHPNLSAGVSYGGHPNSHVTHGHKSFTPGYAMANGVPVHSLPNISPNPRHVGALSRIMRMLSEAAASFSLPITEVGVAAVPSSKPNPNPNLNTNLKDQVLPSSDTHRSQGPPVPASPFSSVYAPSPTLSPFYKTEPLLKKMWDEKDYHEQDEEEEKEGHSSIDKDQPKLKIHKHKEPDRPPPSSSLSASIEGGAASVTTPNKTEKSDTVEIPDHCDVQIAETLTSAAKFVHLVRKLKWDVKVATAVDRESYLKQRQQERDIQLQKDIEEGRKVPTGLKNSSKLNMKEEDQEEEEDDNTFVDVASQGSEFNDGPDLNLDQESESANQGEPPHNYVRGSSRTPKEKHRRSHSAAANNTPTSSLNNKKQQPHTSMQELQSSLDNGLRVDNHTKNESNDNHHDKSEEKGSGEESNMFAMGGDLHDDVNSWICPLTGTYLWREERVQHLLSHPLASKEYLTCWKRAFENLKLTLKQTHIRRRALLIHRQAHMTFAEALCCLIDCKGDENLVFERLAATVHQPIPPAILMSSNNNENDNQLSPSVTHQKNSLLEQRCGENYKIEMRLGAALIGREACQWVSEKRVRKEWNDILERKKMGVSTPSANNGQTIKQQQMNQQENSKSEPGSSWKGLDLNKSSIDEGHEELEHEGNIDVAVESEWKKPELPEEWW